jgi:hypothetical protein
MQERLNCYTTIAAPFHIAQVGSITWIMDDLRKRIKPIIYSPGLFEQAKAFFKDKPMGLGDHMFR